jgi:hypothetical protein
MAALARLTSETFPPKSAAAIPRAVRRGGEAWRPRRDERTSMKVTVDLRVPRWLKRPLTWRVRGAIVAVALLSVGVPVAWASHQFADVPNDQQFHAQIDAIADAGITTGCGGGNYCPNDFVRRDAMAAFMHRGFGRVGEATYFETITETFDVADAAVASLTITPGVPAGALAGANGFFEGHASITIDTPDTGCPCQYRAVIRDETEGSIPFNSFYSDLVVGNSSHGHMSVSGALDVDVAGSHTVELRVFRLSGTGTGAFAYGGLTVAYHPFGSEGGDVLSTSGSVASAPDHIKVPNADE